MKYYDYEYGTKEYWDAKAAYHKRQARFWYGVAVLFGLLAAGQIALVVWTLWH